MTRLSKILLLTVSIFILSSTLLAQESFNWPNTQAGMAFKDLLKAYNTGKLDEVRNFVKLHYGYSNDESIDRVSEYWMDLYYRLGPAEPFAITINQPYDLEVWLQGKISKTWFAPELLLNNENGKIRANGLLMGDQPSGVTTFSKNEEEFVEKLRSYLTKNEKAGLFQGTVLVQKQNSSLLNESYGYKDIHGRVKNEITTRMRISSITKVITAVAVLQLVQQGKLKLNATIDNYLPAFPQHISKKITIYSLLVHTSNYELDGIEGFRESEAECNTFDELYKTQLDFLPKWEKYKDFELATRFDYSNDSYNLLAIIIEKITGIGFHEYLQTNIISPLGMTSTSFSSNDAAIPYRYDIKGDKLTNYESKYGMKISGAGALISTTKDLMKLHNGLLSNKLIDFSYTSSLFAPMVYKGGGDHHSLGMTISYSPVLNIGHNGTNVGNSAEYRYFPELGYTLIVLCNNRSGAQNFYDFFRNNLPLKLDQ